MSFGDLKVQDLIYEDSSNNEITVVIADLATKANPTFTGTVTVPTAPASDVSTKAASTAFVDAYYATKSGAAFTGAVTGTDLTLSGNLVVNGTTTTINTQTLDVEDKNISLGKVSTPSDTTADGGGITLLGSSNKTFNWVNATDAWTSSEHIYLGDNKKLLLGVGAGGVQDLSVYSNGSEGILETQSGGTIKLKCATGSSSTDTFATFSGASSQIDFHKSVLFIGNTKNIVWDNPNDSLYFTDNAKIRLGAGSGVAGDLLLYSNGTVGIIQAPSGQGIHIGNADTEAIIDVEPTQVVFNKNISSQDNDIDIRKSGASKLLWDDSDTAFEFANDVKLTFGGSAGSSGQVLTSGGSGAAPSWAAIPPAGNTVDLVADGAIAAGKPVIITTAGKAKQVADELTAISPITNNGGNYWVGNFNNGSFYDICYDEANEGVWIIYPAGNASNRLDCSFHKIRTGTYNDFIDSSSGNYIEVTVDSSTNCEAPQIEYDPDTQRAVAIWIDGGALRSKVLQYNSSNNSISQGSETTVFSGGALQPTMCYDTTENKMIVGAVRTSSNNRFQTYVGTVTGGSTNSISFGSMSTNAGTTGTTENRFPTLIYDPDNQKVILYVKLDGGAWSNDGAICVGTYTSGMIGWNTTTNMGSSQYAGTIVYDPNVNKFLICYTDTATSSYRTCKVVTVSGTSVSKGSATNGSGALGTGANGYGNQAMTFDPTTNKIVFFYFQENGYDLKCNTGTISGTSISFDSAVMIDGSNIYRSQDFPGFAGTYTKNGQHLFVHRQSNNSNRVYVRNVRTANAVTNVTARNCIGFANSAINDTATGTINLQGSIATGLSGLTPATIYYVQNNGTLGTSTQTTQASVLALASDKGMIQTRVR